jgi:hypothetical protein
MMTHKATISSGYRWRLLAVAVVCLLFAGWSAYDGLVGYPRINRIRADYERLRGPFDGKQITLEHFQAQWDQYKRAHGIPATVDEPDRSKSQFSLIAQYVQVAITLPIGQLFGFTYVATARRWVAAGDQGLTSSRRENVSFGSITRLDKARWKSKGIAVVHYHAGSGEKRLVLDDWKYDREATGAILRLLEARLDRAQIVGGEPEPIDTASTPGGQA